jgi:dihydroxyacetone kinase-like predicted kinase
MAEKKKVKSSEAKSKTKSTNKKKKRSIKYLGGLLLKKMAFGGAKELSTNADEVNKLNVFPVPDGDTGDNMRMTIESGISEMEQVESDNLGVVIKSFSHGMLLGARGNSGVILSQFFAGLASGLEKSEKADPATLGKALELGVKQAYSSVMTPTEGTILTVAREAVEYAVSRITPESTIQTLFSDLSKEMNKSLERTPEILSVLKEAGVVDSGAAGLYHIIDGFNRVLNGQKINIKNNTKKAHSKEEAEAKTAFNADSVME